MSEDAVKLYKKAMVSLQREKLALEKELSSARVIISVTEKRLAEIDAAFSGSSSVNRRGRPTGKIPKKVRTNIVEKHRNSSKLETKVKTQSQENPCFRLTGTLQ